MQVSGRRLREILRENRLGSAGGVYSLCSAHPMVIHAGLTLARDRGQMAVIEATCNQVNQDGGYTGMTPGDFAAQVRSAAADVGLPQADLILGGDHLGPQPWRNLTSGLAMAKAVSMVEAYALAGFGKLHLDCSMPCADDPGTLDDAVVAQRAAQLAAAAEVSARDAAAPLYVIGTEVPAPGGMGAGHKVVPTAAVRVHETWRAHERAFDRMDLNDAFSRVIAIVVQPGVDFGNEDVVQFSPPAAAALADTVLEVNGAVYEAHSTDYQNPENYPALLAMHFAILKVGPAATFALREAIYALEEMAGELDGWDLSTGVRAEIERAMTCEPRHWATHYIGDERQTAYLRHFSYSDRLRYYWTDPGVSRAVDRLFESLRDRPLPPPLVSQYLPQHFRAISSGAVPASATGLCLANIQLALKPYADACGVHPSSAYRSRAHGDG